MDYNYDGIAERIQKVYSSCSANEQQHLKQILVEMSIHGYSQTLEELWLADFKEVPVSIDEFICNPYYLGNTNNNGDMVYPFWKDTVHDIFNAGNRYYEICLSGATRVGKTSTMTLIMAYMLYRLMLYRDPHKYFHKKAVSRFTIGFANLTMELARGICYREFNDTLKECPFFQEHGNFSRSDKNFYYIPEGDKIDIVAGSSGSSFLGMQLWCLTANSMVFTTDGPVAIGELSNSYSTFYQYDAITQERVECTAYVAHTKDVIETIRIELDDGTIIEGTPEHQVMLTDGTYKRLDELTEEDELMEVVDK